jgi:flagellar biogenesis protein FliO
MLETKNRAPLPPSAAPQGGFGRVRLGFRFFVAGIWLLSAWSSGAAQTNTTSGLLSSPALPDAGPSLLRVLGALAVVLGLFLGSVWLFRNGPQIGFRRSRAARLQVLESRSLGGRHSLHVIAYERERFLVASAPGGINLLSSLPPAKEDENDMKELPVAGLNFAEALGRVLRAQSELTRKTEGRD